FPGLRNRAARAENRRAVCRRTAHGPAPDFLSARLLTGEAVTRGMTVPRPLRNVPKTPVTRSRGHGRGPQLLYARSGGAADARRRPAWEDRNCPDEAADDAVPPVVGLFPGRRGALSRDRRRSVQGLRLHGEGQSRR